MAQKLTPHLAEIEALISNHKQKKITAPARTLNAEYKSMTMKKGSKNYTKPCKGPGICKNLLCEHIYAIPPTLDSSMERLLELLLKQSLADGYEISKTYGQEMMVRNSWKLVAALAVAKADIDKRTNALKSSGRIRWPASNKLADLKPESRRPANAYSTPMNTLDEILAFLELEDNHLKHVFDQKSLSPYFKELVKNYPSKKARDDAFAMYSAEAKFRDAREKFLKESKKKGLKGVDLTKVLHQWDLKHDQDAEFRVVGMRAPLDAKPTPARTKNVPEARADGYVPPKVEDASDEGDVSDGACEECGKAWNYCECPCDSSDEDEEGNEDEDEDEVDEEEFQAVLDIVWGNPKTYQSKFVEQFGAPRQGSRYWESGKGTPRMTSRDIAFLRQPKIAMEEKMALFRHYREKNPSLPFLDSAKTRTEVSKLLKLLAINPKTLESGRVTKEITDTLEYYEDQLFEDFISHFSTVWSRNADIAQLSIEDLTFLKDPNNSEAQKLFLYYLRLRINSYPMLPRQSADAGREVFKMILKTSRTNMTDVEISESDEPMSGDDVDETLPHGQLEAELRSRFILGFDTSSLSWTSAERRFINDPHLPTGLFLFVFFQRYRETNYPMLPNDAKTVVKMFALMRENMKKVGIQTGRRDPFTIASEECEQRSVEEYASYLKSKTNCGRSDLSSRTLDLVYATHLMINYVKMAQDIPETFNSLNEYSTFKRVFKEANPHAPHDEETVKKFFTCFHEVKKKISKELEESEIDMTDKGGAGFEMSQDSISKLFDEFGKHAQVESEVEYPYEELCKMVISEDGSHLEGGSDNELLPFRRSVEKLHSSLRLASNEASAQNSDDIFNEGLAKIPKKTAVVEATSNKKSKKRKPKYKLLTPEEYVKKDETQLIKEIEELENRYPTLSFVNIVLTDVDKAFINDARSKEDIAARWYRIWLNANATIFKADHPTLRHYEGLMSALLCHGNDEYGQKERMTRVTRNYEALTEEQLVQQITTLESYWPSLNLDKVDFKSEDEAVFENPNTTKLEHAALLRTRWKEMNRPLIPNADSIMAHYSFLQKALADKLVSAKTSQELQKEFEVREQTHPLKIITRVNNWQAKRIDQLQEEIEDLENKYPCLNYVNFVFTALTPEDDAFLNEPSTTEKQKGIRLEELYDKRRRLYLSDSNPDFIRYEALLATRRRKELELQKDASFQRYENVRKEALYTALNKMNPGGLTAEKAAAIMRYNSAPLQKEEKRPGGRSVAAPKGRVTQLAALPPKEAAADVMSRSPISTSKKKGPPAVDPAAKTKLSDALPKTQAEQATKIKLFQDYLPPPLHQQPGAPEDDEAAKIERLHSVIPLIVGSESLVEKLKAQGVVTPQQLIDMECLRAQFEQLTTKEQEDFVDISVTWLELNKPAEGYKLSTPLADKDQIARGEAMLASPPSGMQAESSVKIASEDVMETLKKIRPQGYSFSDAAEVMRLGHALDKLIVEDRTGTMEAIITRIYNNVKKHDEDAKAIQTPSLSSGEKKLLFLHQYNNITPPPRPEAIRIFNKEIDAVETQLGLERVSGRAGVLNMDNFQETADLDKIPIIDDEIGKIVMLNGTKAEIDEIKGLLTESEANEILGLDATEAKKKLLFWERYLAKHPELHEYTRRAAEKRIGFLNQEDDRNKTLALASKVPGSIAEIHVLKHLIQNLPESPLATATTWLTIKDTLESDEARGAMEIRARQDLLVELEKAEMAYEKKHGMKPTVTPEESKAQINERILSIVEKFSIEEPLPTDDVHPSESPEQDAKVDLSGLKPEILTGYGAIVDRNRLMLQFYSTFKKLKDKMPIQGYPAAWQEDIIEIVKIFEDEYLPAMVRLKALELHLASFRKAPAPDETSYEADVDQPKSKSKSNGLLNKAAGTLRKLPTPKKIGDNLFRNLASKKIGEKLKKLEEENMTIEEAGKDVVDTLDAGIVRGLATPTGPIYPDIVLEEDETDSSDSSTDSSSDDSDEAEADRARPSKRKANRAEVLKLYAGTTLHPIKTPSTGLFDKSYAYAGNEEKLAGFLNLCLKEYDKTLDPSIRPYFKHFVKLQAWVENAELSEGPFKSDEICHIMVKCFINSYGTAVNMLSISGNDVKVAMRLYLHITVGLEKYFAGKGVAKPTQAMYEEKVDAFAVYVWNRRQFMMEPYVEESDDGGGE